MNGTYAYEGARTSPNMRFIRSAFSSKLKMDTEVLTHEHVQYALDNGFTLQAYGTAK